jgi:hypothetical protein
VLGYLHGKVFPAKMNLIEDNKSKCSLMTNPLKFFIDICTSIKSIRCKAEALIDRRQRWVNNKMKKDLISKRPVLFSSFCHLFWRNLDEDDPDGDEWQGLIASDQFHSQSIAFLNKLRMIERSLQQCRETAFAM